MCHVSALKNGRSNNNDQFPSPFKAALYIGECVVGRRGVCYRKKYPGCLFNACEHTGSLKMIDLTDSYQNSPAFALI